MKSVATIAVFVLTWGCLPSHSFVTKPSFLEIRRTSSSLESRLYLTTITTAAFDDSLLTPRVYDTIRQGRIAVIPDFLPAAEILALRSDAQALHGAGKFSTDALASYGTSGKFDASRDRAVLRLNQWKDVTLGTWDTRQRFGQRMAALRTELATQLQRPRLDTGKAVTQFGNGSTEISYTRFGPGAFLKRHVDEHHEELKGVAGWSQPTRRSISWLIYLNENWNGRVDGGHDPMPCCKSKI